MATTTKQLEVLNLNDDSIKLLTCSSIVKHRHDTNALGMHDLTVSHPQTRLGDLDGIEHPDFAMHKKKIHTKN